MEQEIRLGTIGSGMIVREILGHVQETEGISLACVYSRSRETGRALADSFGAETVHTDLERFLEDSSFSTVYIASPNLLHYEQARMALEAGKNVICEKPLCTRADQVQDLADLARERGLMLADATPTAYLPNLEILRSQLARIGRVRLVLANYSQYSSRYDALLRGEQPNIFSPAFGGGCLMDINYYNVYLTVALFGLPRRAVYSPNLYEGKIDTSGIASLEYDGFVCSLAGAKDTWGENFYQIEGEKGYIRIPGGSNGLRSVQTVTRDGESTWNDQPNPSRWHYEISRLTPILRSGDRDALLRRTETARDTIAVLEQMRAGAGIRFPGDRPEEEL